MNVVAAGVVVRWEPSGFTVVGWHRHERLVDDGAEDSVFDRLTQGEMIDVIEAHLSCYLPGMECLNCQGWAQQHLRV